MNVRQNSTAFWWLEDNGSVTRKTVSRASSPRYCSYAQLSMDEDLSIPETTDQPSIIEMSVGLRLGFIRLWLFHSPLRALSHNDPSQGEWLNSACMIECSANCARFRAMRFTYRGVGHDSQISFICSGYLTQLCGRLLMLQVSLCLTDARSKMYWCKGLALLLLRNHP